MGCIRGEGSAAAKGKAKAKSEAKAKAGRAKAGKEEKAKRAKAKAKAKAKVRPGRRKTSKAREWDISLGKSLTQNSHHLKIMQGPTPAPIQTDLLSCEVEGQSVSTTLRS